MKLITRWEPKVYYVYVIRFGEKYYYGVTSDIDKRKMSHHYNIKRAFYGYTNGYANLKVHLAGAAYFKKVYGKIYSSPSNHQLFLRLYVCFQSTEKEVADEVECFLINKSIKDKNCLNTRHSLKKSSKLKY